MHFVTGGNFNGKRAWVKKEYPKAMWISAYEGNNLLKHAHELTGNTIVLEGVEQWIKLLAEEIDFPRVRDFVYECFDSWSIWEKDKDTRQVVVIGTDITKGVVPLEKKDRLWRDMTGWVYQDIAELASRVDVIWYGLNQTIKNEEQSNEC